MCLHSHAQQFHACCTTVLLRPGPSCTLLGLVQILLITCPPWTQTNHSLCLHKKLHNPWAHGQLIRFDVLPLHLFFS